MCRKKGARDAWPGLQPGGFPAKGGDRKSYERRSAVRLCCTCAPGTCEPTFHGTRGGRAATSIVGLHPGGAAGLPDDRSTGSLHEARAAVQGQRAAKSAASFAGQPVGRHLTHVASGSCRLTSAVAEREGCPAGKAGQMSLTAHCCRYCAVRGAQAPSCVIGPATALLEALSSRRPKGDSAFTDVCPSPEILQTFKRGRFRLHEDGGAV